MDNKAQETFEKNPSTFFRKMKGWRCLGLGVTEGEVLEKGSLGERMRLDVDLTSSPPMPSKCNAPLMVVN